MWCISKHFQYEGTTNTGRRQQTGRRCQLHHLVALFCVFICILDLPILLSHIQFLLYFFVQTTSRCTFQQTRSNRTVTGTYFPKTFCDTADPKRLKRIFCRFVNQIRFLEQFCVTETGIGYSLVLQTWSMDTTKLQGKHCQKQIRFLLLWNTVTFPDGITVLAAIRFLANFGWIREILSNFEVIVLIILHHPWSLGLGLQNKFGNQRTTQPVLHSLYVAKLKHFCTTNFTKIHSPAIISRVMSLTISLVVLPRYVW